VAPKLKAKVFRLTQWTSAIVGCTSLPNSVPPNVLKIDDGKTVEAII